MLLLLVTTAMTLKNAHVTCLTTLICLVQHATENKKNASPGAGDIRRHRCQREELPPKVADLGGSKAVVSIVYLRCLVQIKPPGMTDSSVIFITLC